MYLCIDFRDSNRLATIVSAACCGAVAGSREHLSLIEVGGIQPLTSIVPSTAGELSVHVHVCVVCVCVCVGGGGGGGECVCVGVCCVCVCVCGVRV